MSVWLLLKASVKINAVHLHKHAAGRNALLCKEDDATAFGSSQQLPASFYACSGVGVRSRKLFDRARKPEQHDKFWQAQAAECVLSSQSQCSQTLGALAVKYGLGTKYDPFATSELNQ